MASNFTYNCLHLFKWVIFVCLRMRALFSWGLERLCLIRCAYYGTTPMFLFKKNDFVIVDHWNAGSRSRVALNSSLNNDIRKRTATRWNNEPKCISREAVSTNQLWLIWLLPPKTWQLPHSFLSDRERRAFYYWSSIEKVWINKWKATPAAYFDPFFLFAELICIVDR